jgi:hypothetical protein
MKKKILCTSVCTLLIMAALPAVGIATTYEENFSHDENDDLKTSNFTPDTILLTTLWGQWNPYNTKCPIDPDTGNPHRLGCWSTAIGQIMRFHELQSHGLVEYYYQNKDGDPIPLVNNLNDFDYDWDYMPDELNGSSSPEEIDHVSQILYDTATVIRKNFGHNNYVINSSRMVEELIEHFQYISVQTEVEKLPDIEKIKDEIDSYRPCMLYLEKTTGGGHAVVIDGWRVKRDFEVHLNMGWKGKNNSWYVYDEPILDYDNNSVRTIILIRIAPNKPQKPIGPLTGAPGVEYDFTTTTTVKNELPIYYKWDWDDGTFSDWLGRYESGEICDTSHTWNIDGWESPWSDPLAIEMPRNRATSNVLFYRFLEQFPILRLLLQR